MVFSGFYPVDDGSKFWSTILRVRKADMQWWQFLLQKTIVLL